MVSSLVPVNETDTQDMITALTYVVIAAAAGVLANTLRQALKSPHPLSANR